ncbi:MAG TPA: hypothetical protein DEA31_02780 [Alphaproteobacteria bacterium]|nr:hypothetical protein [Alphaproteobacteria bacterium]
MFSIPVDTGCSCVGDSRPHETSVHVTIKTPTPIAGWRAANTLNKHAITGFIVLNLQPPEFLGGFLLFAIQKKRERTI